jgi:hypothetical protein
MASLKMLRAELPVHSTKMLIITHCLSVHQSTIQGAAGYAAASCYLTFSLRGGAGDRDRTVCAFTTIFQKIGDQRIHCRIIGAIYE